METSPINVTDLGIILILLVSGVFAFFRGLVHELLAVVSWIGAAIATLYGFPFAQPEARKLISVPLIADMAAGVGIFLIVLVLLSVLTRVVSHRIRHSSLGPLDRSLGLIFGFLRGAVLVCLAWLAFIWLLPPEDHPEWITEARALPLVERGSAALTALAPEHLREQIPKSAPAGSEAGTQSYRSLLDPAVKDDAPGAEPGYNSRMRQEMQRAIEAATQGLAGAEEGAKE
jgi:membrane protein required for colicin V production